MFPGDPSARMETGDFRAIHAHGVPAVPYFHPARCFMKLDSVHNLVKVTGELFFMIVFLTSAITLIGCSTTNNDPTPTPTATATVTPTPTATPIITFIRTYGGSGNDSANSVWLTETGGYLFIGSTNSFGPDHGYWVETDPFGNEIQSRTFGMDQGGGDVCDRTSDGGFIITGHSESGIPLLKVDARGDIEWFTTIAGYSGNYIKQTLDGGYIITGGSDQLHIALIKTDARGIVVWYRIFASSNIDNGNCVSQTTDGGYIVCGQWDIDAAESQAQVILLKTNADGEEEWRTILIPVLYNYHPH